tara:strand:+ start:3110 stop:4651 length:1542 start_codon:yes stop_codon:yes gene_type:complete
MNKRIIFLIASWFLIASFSMQGQEDWPLITPGVNLDFSTTEVNKTGYDSGFVEAFDEAGFKSVRYFVKHGQDPIVYKQAVDNALERGQTVVLVAFSAKTNGKEKFIKFWKDYAEFYKMYPKELIFELMNEPEMAGHPNAEKLSVAGYKHPWTDEEAKVVMDWIGEAVVAIRATSPTRILAIGGVGHNNVRYIKYVSSKYLDYKLPDGSGFDEDKNIWGVFHLYVPSGWSHSGRPVTLNQVNPDWRKEVVKNLDQVVSWTKKQNKKVILTEWGTRMYNDHKDLKKYFNFIVKETKNRDIEWMQYCGVFNNSWDFALFSSEKGWDETADLVEILTGISPTVVPPTSQINNSSFEMDVDHWYSSEQVNITSVDGQGVKGSRAMRCNVAFTKPNPPYIYQQTPSNWKFPVKDGMLQLRKGNTYDISFYAKTTGYRTKIGVQLGLAPDNEVILWDSDIIEINTELTKYQFTYTHTAGSEEDVRLSFIFSDRHSEIILDDIKFRGTRPEYAKYLKNKTN